MTEKQISSNSVESEHFDHRNDHELKAELETTISEALEALKKSIQHNQSLQSFLGRMWDKTGITIYQ